MNCRAEGKWFVPPLILLSRSLNRSMSWSFDPQTFAAASTAQKIVMIDEAIARCIIAQETGTGANKVVQADLEQLQALRKYYVDLQQQESSGDYGFFPVEFDKG